MLKYYAQICLYMILFLEGCKTIVIEESQEQKIQSQTLQTQKSLIMHYLDQGKPTQAYIECRNILKKYPNDPELLNLMGLSLLALKQPKLALQNFEKSYKINPQAATGLNIGAAMLELNMFNEAISFLKSLLKKHKTYIYKERIYHNIGVAYEKIKRYELAEKYYLKAINENPIYIISVMKLGQLYQILNKPTLAQQKFEEALYKCPNCYDPLEALVNTLSSMNQKDKAKEIIKKYLSQKTLRDEDNTKALALLKSLEASQ